MPAFELYLPRTYSAWRTRRQRTQPAAAAWALMATWIERTHQRNTLAGLDDHQLRDIGITRRDVARECRKPFWR